MLCSEITEFFGRKKITDNLKTTLTNKLCELIDTENATDFYAGGAIGWDTLCAQTIIMLRLHYPQIKLHLVLPCDEVYQTAKWNDEQKRLYKKILTAADNIEYTSQKYFDGCMKKRNARLVELSDICVCYYNKNIKTSGTGQTVRMALQKKIHVINIFDLTQN